MLLSAATHYPRKNILKNLVLGLCHPRLIGRIGYSNFKMKKKDRNIYPNSIFQKHMNRCPGNERSLVLKFKEGLTTFHYGGIEILTLAQEQHDDDDDDDDDDGDDDDDDDDDGDDDDDDDDDDKKVDFI